MRYTLALFVMLAGCSPAAPVSDAGALPSGWEECPAECVAACAPPSGPYAWCGEDLPPCSGCRSLCALPTDDAAPSEVECDSFDFFCGGTSVGESPPLGGRCFRRR